MVRSCAEKGLVFESEKKGREVELGARVLTYVEMPCWVDGMLTIHVYNSFFFLKNKERGNVS